MRKHPHQSTPFIEESIRVAGHEHLSHGFELPRCKGEFRDRTGWLEGGVQLQISDTKPLTTPANS